MTSYYRILVLTASGNITLKCLNDIWNPNELKPMMYLGRNHKCNSTLVLTFKCDTGYGIGYPKNGAEMGVRKKTVSIKRAAKQFCDHNGKLPRSKIPKCISTKRRRKRKNAAGR